MKAYTALRWRAGAPPLWNPLSGCGEPWLAQLQTGVFYPGDLPFLLPSLSAAVLLAIALHLCVATAGMAAWLWDLGCSRRAALAAAGLYGAAGPLLSLVPVYNNFCTAAWLPWVFLGARRVVRREGAQAFAVPAALSFLAGEPALAAAGAVSALAIAVLTRAEGEPGRPEHTARALGRALPAALLALGLVAVTAIPLGELLLRSGRLGNATYDEAVARPVGPRDLAGVVLPISAEESRRGSAGRGGYVVTLAMGPLPILLAAGCAAGFPGRRRLLLLLALLGGGALLLALGERGLLVPALYRLGVFRGLRYPARWIIFTHLALAVAVAAGLDGFLWGRFRSVTAAEESESRARPGDSSLLADDELPHPVAPARWTLLGGLALLATMTASALLGRVGDPWRLGAVGIAFLVGAAALALARAGRLDAQRAAGVVLLAVLAPLPLVAADALEGAPAELLGKAPPVVADLLPDPRGRVFVACHDPTLLARFTLPAGIWSPESARRSREALAGYQNLRLGIATTGSPSPIGQPRLSALLGGALEGGDPLRVLALADTHHMVSPFPFRGARADRQTGGLLRYSVPSPAGRSFFTRRVEAGDDAAISAAVRRRDFAPEETAYVEAGAAVPGLSNAGGRGYAVARFVRDDPESAELAVSASRASFLVLTRSWDPGWSALLDGVPARLLRTDAAFLGLLVPAGEHRVALSYRPRGYREGAVVSAASLFLLVVLVLAGGPRRET